MKSSDIENILKVIQSLDNEVRINIFLNISEADARGVRLNIKEAIFPYKLPRSSMAHHVKIMVESGLLTRKKEGKNVFLSLNKLVLREVLELLNIC